MMEINPKTLFQQVTVNDIEELVVSGLCDLVNNPLDYLLETIYWKWRYFESSTSKDNQSMSSLMVAVRDGQVIGKVGNLSLPMQVGGKQVTIPLMEGLSFHPDFRSWLHFRSMMALSYQSRQHLNPEFSFAVTPRPSLELYRRIGCHVIEKLPVYTGIINGNDFARLRGLPFPLSLAGGCLHPLFGVRFCKRQFTEITIHRIDHFGTEFDKLWNTIAPLRCLAITKNADYLNWRYARHPGKWYELLAAYRDGQLCGLVVFRKVSSLKCAYILELMAANDDFETMNALLNTCLKQIKVGGMASVTASFLKNSPVQPLLKATGFSSLPTRFWDMQLIVEIPNNQETVPAGSMVNWDLSLGDWLLH